MLFPIRDVKNILTVLYFGTLKRFMFYKLMIIGSNQSKNTTSKMLIKRFQVKNTTFVS